jgi:hypothetical protein
MKYLLFFAAFVVAVAIFMLYFIFLSGVASLAASALGLSYSLSPLEPLLPLTAALGFAITKYRNLSTAWRAGVAFGLIYGLIYGLGTWAISSTVGATRPAGQALTPLVVAFIVISDALFAGVSAFAGGFAWRIVAWRLLPNSQR